MVGSSFIYGNEKEFAGWLFRNKEHYLTLAHLTSHLGISKPYQLPFPHVRLTSWSLTQTDYHDTRSLYVRYTQKTCQLSEIWSFYLSVMIQRKRRKNVCVWWAGHFIIHNVSFTGILVVKCKLYKNSLKTRKKKGMRVKKNHKGAIFVYLCQKIKKSNKTGATATTKNYYYYFHFIKQKSGLL